MPKLRLQISVLVCLLLHIHLRAQDNYTLTVRGIDKDAAFLSNHLGIPASFSTRSDCIQYINELPAILQSKGYVTASLDSIKYDSISASVVLFVGEV